MPERIQSAVVGAIERRAFPGCVIGVVRANGDRNVVPFGRLTYDTESPIVTTDTIYDLASITKSVPVASLTLSLVGEGKLDLSDTVKKYIPELHNDYGATIEDLLTYRVKGPQMSNLRNKTPDEIFDFIFSHGFNASPSKSQYTNLPAFLLGIVIERMTGESLGACAAGKLFGPLKMHTTLFSNIGVYETTNIAPTEIGENGEEIRGIVHDESARVFARARRAVGHAGLFSTTPDLLNFLEALLQGKYPHVVAGAQKGLGWQTSAPWFMGHRVGPSAFGKTGFTGTSVVCDVDRGIALVVLSNRTYPQRPPDATSINSAINALRAEIADIVFG